MINRSGSPDVSPELLPLTFVPAFLESGTEVVALISASINSAVMSRGDSFCACAISASVRVRSTRVSRPSLAERRRRLSGLGVSPFIAGTVSASLRVMACGE